MSLSLSYHENSIIDITRGRHIKFYFIFGLWRHLRSLLSYATRRLSGTITYATSCNIVIKNTSLSRPIEPSRFSLRHLAHYTFPHFTESNQHITCAVNKHSLIAVRQQVDPRTLILAVLGRVSVSICFRAVLHAVCRSSYQAPPCRSPCSSPRPLYPKTDRDKDKPSARWKRTYVWCSEHNRDTR